MRIAVGAQRGQVVWMVLRDCLMLTAFGVTSYVFAALGVAVVAIAASVIPARRAARIDPLAALRSE